MRKLLTATALVATLFSSSAFAVATDKSDKDAYSCNKDTIEEKMTALAENGRAGKMGIKLIFIKGDPVETKRTKDELRCKVTAMYSTGPVKGIFFYKNDDDHALVGFQPGASK